MVSTLEQMQVPNGTGPGVRRSKHPLLASRTRCNVLWKPIFREMSVSVMLRPVKKSHTGRMSNAYGVSLVSTSRTNASPKWDRTRCPEE